PSFDESATPRTEKAREIISQCDYQRGVLLVHIQKTYSLPIEKYCADIISKRLNNTPHQIKVLQEATERSKAFIDKHPLPKAANKERILGLLTVFVEHVISLTNLENYKDLHEKADRPVLSI